MVDEGDVKKVLKRKSLKKEDTCGKPLDLQAVEQTNLNIH